MVGLPRKERKGKAFGISQATAYNMAWQ
jgi:hypothetical protein